MDVSKGGFPLGEINNDFAAIFIWVCAFLFVYSLAGEIFLLKIVKIMNLTNLQRKKSPQLLDQSKNYLSTLSVNTFHQIKSKMTANNISSIHVSLDVPSTLMSLQLGNLYKLQQHFCMTSPQAVVRRCSVKKLLLKFT